MIINISCYNLFSLTAYLTNFDDRISGPTILIYCHAHATG